MLFFIVTNWVGGREKFEEGFFKEKQRVFWEKDCVKIGKERKLFRGEIKMKKKLREFLRENWKGISGKDLKRTSLPCTTLYSPTI